ncbi:MAG: amidohydrolase [Abitibacteriaceae bacterium]|nr:amidohydrolase [Abditibacteriaceae bacterium]
MSRISLSPVTAVTCNEQFDIIEQAAIHIDGSRIVYVGPATAAPPFVADETIGGEHLVAIPGLINVHTHSAMTLLRGYADDMALEPWLQEMIWPFERHLQADDVYWGTLLAICEMIRGGTTCFADMYHFYEHGTHAMIESGIRACPSAVLLGFLPEPERRIANGFAFVREFKDAGEGRITPFLGPHSLYTCNREQWAAIIQGAYDLQVPITTHAAETRREVADVTAQWGAGPIETLKSIGALDGPLLAAHCVYADDRDIAMLAEINAVQGNGIGPLRVAHNPTSNLKLASGFAPVPKFLEAGITVGLGPDGTASNNNLNMWEEIHLAALLHKATTGDPTVISAQQALLMATREGAKCLNLEDSIGTLEAGKKADVVLVDFDKPHLYPRHNVVSHLVYAANSADVDTVLVDGKVLLRKTNFTTLDVHQICAQASTRASRLATEHHQAVAQG